MKRAVWCAVRDAFFYGLILWKIWYHTHWSVFTLLTIFCVRALFEDLLLMRRKAEDQAALTKLDNLWEGLKQKRG
jgi:hypothetical protein